MSISDKNYRKRIEFNVKDIAGQFTERLREFHAHHLLIMPYIIILLFMVNGCRLITGPTLPDRFELRDDDSTIISDDEFPWYIPDMVKMEDREYSDNIRTVKLFKEGFELSMPVLELGSNERLQLIFDDLDAIYKEYRYRIVHCDAFWEPTDIFPADYIEGFTEGFITHTAFSKATRQPYVNYRAFFPNPDMKITKSGNYVVLVYPADEPQNIVLSRRFMLYESRVTVTAYARRSSVVSEMRQRQEINFEIETGGYEISNPYNDIIVKIQQNGRWDNAIVDIKPRLVRGTVLKYDWERINVFDGLNEYRHIDLRSLSRLTPRVAMIERDKQLFHVYVRPDFKRAYQVYVEDRDLNGEYIIRNEDAISDDYTESDYAWVHFTFPYNSPFDHGAIYIFGALTNWQYTPEGRMTYNYDKRTYEVSLFLKQGYYNYHYMFLDNTGLVGNTTLTEGNHYETENFYTIYVYHRQPGSLYDQLIAVERIIAPRQP